MSKVQRSRPSAAGAFPKLAPSIESPVIEQRSAPDLQSPAVSEPVRSAVPEPVSTQPEQGQPLYLQLLRKELRLRVDQADALAALRRQLMRRRADRSGDVITDNTLIRVANDLHLTRTGELRGDTEDDLRRSVGLPEVAD